MAEKLQNIGKIVEEMDKQLRTDLLQESQLWEKTFIKYQIDRRNRKESFGLKDHIRAMVYSMLSGGRVWDGIAQDIDAETRCMKRVDEIFCQYDPTQLLECSPEQLSNKVTSIRCGNRRISEQMKALLSVNIPKLLSWEKEYGSVDAYYRSFEEQDQTLKSLVKNLSEEKGNDKLAELGPALVCEYLRNVGYDLPKPDGHICRILGSGVLGYSEKETVPVYEAFDLVKEIAESVHKSVAEVDYILWSYCADGYGEVCTKNKPKCDICAAKEYCKK